MKKDYSLLLDLLDHGWEVKEFNSKEVTLRPVDASAPGWFSLRTSDGGYHNRVHYTK